MAQSMNGLITRDVNGIIFKTNHYLGDCVGTPIFLHPWVLVYSVVVDTLPLLAVIGCDWPVAIWPKIRDRVTNLVNKTV